MILLLLFGCLDPFPTDRHDLVDLRIAAMGLDAEGGLRGFVWEGTDAWSPTAPARTWEILELGCTGASCGSLPSGTFNLKVTGATDAEEQGQLRVEDEATIPELGGASRVLGEAGASLALELPDAAMVRWMAPVGEIAETGFAATTYTAPLEPDGTPKAGVWPLVALWMDGRGGNDWATFDVPIGLDGPFLAVGSRLFPVDTDLPSGPTPVLATLAATDDLTGFALTDLAVDDGMATRDFPCGATVAGEGASGDWDPDSVIERVCGRDEVVGARVRIVGEIVR